MPTRALLDTFRPLLDAARDVDLAQPGEAERVLRGRLDPASPEARKLVDELEDLLERGAICDRGEPPVRWGRVAKASPETGGFSIDVVLMTGPGPRHRHPNGEIDFCIARDGAPRFDDREPGWVVYGPDSTHVPTVTGGEMLIVYLLPEGAMEFL